MPHRTLLLAVTLLAGWTLAGCDQEPEASADASRLEQTLDELQRKYDEVVAGRLEDPVSWAADDIENLGDWEYRVENLAFTTAEDLAAQLNEYGNERWEVIWLEKTPSGFLAILKKPSISYLSKIPLSQLGRLVIGGDSGESGN